MRPFLTRIILLTFFPLTHIVTQDKTPLLSGSVDISIAQGTFECDLTLSNIPQIDDYYIRINSGMNILHMRSIEPNDFLVYYNKSLKDSLSTGESNAYYFSDNTGEGKFLPQSIQFKYVGKFPVVKDTIQDYSVEDWKGNIAFNHNSVRSDGYQSAWYPILYDIQKDKLLHKVTYDIELTCTDCTTMYVNGNKPIKAKSYNFKSDIPHELTLFCGNYDFTSLNNTYFLNSGLSPDEIQEFGNLINYYKSFYVKNINIPFDQPVSFVQTTPVSKNNQWMFVSYPTIMSIGWQNGLKSVIDPAFQNFYRPFMAHELGHFYFGTYKVFNSELGDMMTEGFSEFLSLKLTKNIIGEDIFKEKVHEKIENLKDFSATPFAKIKSQSEYSNRQLYVYNYAPLIFLAIEKEIGEKQMWQWINNILITPTQFTDYDFLITTLQQTLTDTNKVNTLKSLYLESPKSLENAISTIGVK